MTDSVYRPPKTELIAETDSAPQRFYVVSKTKLSVLYFATLGLYLVYWFYVNWKNYKNVTGQNLLPVLRAVFYVFFTHSLFKEVDKELKLKQLTFDWSPSAHATLLVLLAILSNVIDRVLVEKIGSSLADLSTLAILPVILLILLKVQDAINLSQEDKTGDSNSIFTVYNYLWIVPGTILWAFIAIAVAMEVF